ncbi:hypothetical protein EVAR_47331_1 [Eumeta japonica]|uniref:Uncharacterized protein n=1 Tax=Eumeta variegata TaxID=151549 RepID=A0A4C1WV06_EUMVA|nr:hypothetical protein EVAR_47331_1 [Eumeta japonica]
MFKQGSKTDPREPKTYIERELAIGSAATQTIIHDHISAHRSVHAASISDRTDEQKSRRLAAFALKPYEVYERQGPRQAPPQVGRAETASAPVHGERMQHENTTDDAYTQPESAQTSEFRREKEYTSEATPTPVTARHADFNTLWKFCQFLR